MSFLIFAIIGGKRLHYRILKNYPSTMRVSEPGILNYNEFIFFC
jgi:hypothetical protein